MDAFKITSIVVALFCLLIGLIFGLGTLMLREQNEKDSPYSFSKVQLWLWTIIICPAFVLYWGFHPDHIPEINDVSLILLGISVGTITGAGIIATVQYSDNKNIGYKQDVHHKNFWYDILVDDRGQFSIGRLQNLLFTLIYVVIYIVMFWSKGFIEYPNFNSTSFVLMGISTSGYLIGKGMRH